jgi:hypothetical protein
LSYSGCTQHNYIRFECCGFQEDINDVGSLNYLMGSEVSAKLSGVFFTLSDFPVPSTKKQFIGGSHPPLSICSVKMRAFVPPANGLP